MHLRKKVVSFIGLGFDGLANELYSYLKSHPNVLVKERIDFFSKPSIFAKGVDWYENEFINNANSKKCGELSSGYISNVLASNMIAKNYPDAKLFAVIDNPLLAIKILFVVAKLRGEIFTDMDLEHFLKRNPEVLERCFFGRFLTHYFSYYSHNDLLIVTADDVNNEPLRILSTTYEFLDLDKNFVPSDLKFLIPEDEEDPKKRGGVIKRSFKYVFKTIKRFFSFFVNKLKTKESRPDVLLVEARALKLSPSLEKSLKDYYRKDVQILSELLHRNFIEEWGF